MAARLLTLVATALAAVGCTGGTEGPPERAGAPVPFVESRCPVDVAAALLGTVECGTLRVPENRRERTGEVSLLVTTLTPAHVTSEDPVVVVGTDIATRPNYAGIGPLAGRTGRRVVFLEQRGTAHSVPSLSCPDGTGAAVVWTLPTGSSAWRRAAAERTRECFARLTDQGVDVAAYDVLEMAEDLAELIEVRDLAPATLISYGTSSRIALELLRRHADLVGALVLDTPELPGVDPRALAPTTTKSAIATVLRWCRADRDCSTRYQEPTTLLRRALAELSARPLRLDAQTSIGDVRVVLGPGLLVRVARQSMTDGGSAGTWGLPEALPRLFTAVVNRDRSALRPALGELLGAQGPWCAGYRNKCMAAHSVTEGVWNTVLCRDVAPLAAPNEPRSVAGPGFRQAYDAGWWWEVCPQWSVPPVDAGTADPPTSDVPVLVLVGGLAPPVPEATIRRWMGGMQNASIVVAPTGSHNVLGFDCIGKLRDSWLTDPRPLPPRPECLATRLEW